MIVVKGSINMLGESKDWSCQVRQDLAARSDVKHPGNAGCRRCARVNKGHWRGTESKHSFESGRSNHLALNLFPPLVETLVT